MDLASRYKGVVGLVFGDNPSSNEDSYIQRLLDRISNGTLPDDRRSAIVELQSVVAERNAAQLAFGASGFPVVVGILKDQRDDVEMVRGALETLLGALTPIDHARAQKTEVHAALMNSDLLSREAENITLLLSLLEEEDFYVRYFTLQILTALLMNSQNRLQEAILTTPRGITRLMDMLMDREVIRNEALLLLTHLTREAEEIQKIVVFEGAFEKIFSIIKEEGGSDGDVVVQDCLELLKNLLRNSSSNQILLRETMGFEPIISVLKLRGITYKFTQQKTVNLLCALETINMLIMGGAVTDPGKESNKLANRTVFVQKKLLDHLLMLGVESQWSPVAVRCMTFKCIGDLVDGHPKNRDILASKVLGEDRQAEPALNSILRIILQTSSIQEFVAADYVFKTFCEKNREGQAMLASTLIPQPHPTTRDPLEDDVNMSFGSMLLRGIFPGETDGDLETCCRAASILSHVLKDNIQCKEKALKIVLESPVPSMGTPEPLFQRISSLIFSSSSERPREDHKPLTRTATPSEGEIEDVDVAGAMDKGNEDHPMLISLFDPSFTGLVKSLEGSIRERIVDVYSRPKSEVAVVPADLEQRSGENEKDYINRLKAFIEKQCSEIQNLLARNAALAEDVASSGRNEQSQGSEQRARLVGRIQQSRTSELPSREREAIKEEVRKEAQKESEDELNDLLVCLGQEESKVEKLTAKLVELGVDVDKLLEDIGDELQAQGECEDDDDDDH
ncbi:BnaCnng51860D [Brassica napus]|uniref:BnaCnng51860D protein n=1 Tax=Brassica napus TaxID=3708 RepID=A0A078JMS0_BRANA|nr:BnaCnng51860D [Brassica napus]